MSFLLQNDSFYPWNAQMFRSRSDGRLRVTERRMNFLKYFLRQNAPRILQPPWKN